MEFNIKIRTHDNTDTFRKCAKCKMGITSDGWLMHSQAPAEERAVVTVENATTERNPAPSITPVPAVWCMASCQKVYLSKQISHISVELLRKCSDVRCIHQHVGQTRKSPCYDTASETAS